MSRLISLDDPAALDTGTVGHKAAELARARAAGLPVLAGWVLPLEEAAAAASLGAEILARDGRAAATLAIADLELDADLQRDLADVAAALGPSLIVRSSTTLDTDARWSGAFATYQEVAVGELTAAVHGCWFSAFSRDALARAEVLGVASDQMRVAVLIQPMLRLGAAGTAFASPDGQVTVSGVTGSPDSLASDVAELTRAAATLLRDDAIEWGVERGQLFLLQAQRRTLPSSQTTGSHARPPRTRIPLPDALRVARLAARFPGALGEELVLPWALGSRVIEPIAEVVVDDPAAAYAEIRALGLALTGAAWRMSPEAARRHAGDTLRLLRGDDPHRARTVIPSLAPVDEARTSRLLGLAIGLGRQLVEAGLLSHPDGLWRLTAAELARAVTEHHPPPRRLGPDRWEPFVFDTVRRAGAQAAGTSAAPGIGAGRLFRVDPAGGWPFPGPRCVLAVPAPLPQLAPLLWGCAGVVSATGNIGAHLFAVARALGVPAVVGAWPNEGDTNGELLVAVDGGSGTVFSVDAGCEPDGVAAVAAWTER